MRGRKPVPTALRIMRGNPGKRPLPADEPSPPPLEVTRPPPEWLDDEAQTEWRRIAPMLARNGLLTEVDLDALTAYCLAWCTWKKANRAISQFGMVIKAKNGYVMQSPYIPIANKAMATMKGLMLEFGMTPSSRSRVSKSDGALAPSNPLERFLNRKR
jgi:P27 family predicted phage terminase small subunit